MARCSEVARQAREDNVMELMNINRRFSEGHDDRMSNFVGCLVMITLITY